MLTERVVSDVKVRTEDDPMIDCNKESEFPTKEDQIHRISGTTSGGAIFGGALAGGAGVASSLERSSVAYWASGHFHSQAASHALSHKA